MKFNNYFSTKKVMAFTTAAAVVGMSFMLVISAKADKNNIAEGVTYTNPSAGMASILSGYMDSNGDSSIDLLSTTAVGTGISGNKYYDENGDSVGHLIVSVAEDYAPVYLIKDDTSGVYGKIYQYGTATLIEQDGEWCKIVSGVISGYVKASDFAFGTAAETLDSLTYETVAIIDTDELTLREEQSMTSIALCILSPQSEHTVIEEDDGSGWTKLYVDGVGQGYVLTEYLQIKTVQMTGVTVDEEFVVASTIDSGVEEAMKREAQWTADRIAAEEAAAQARAEAEAAAQAAQSETIYTESYEYDEETYVSDSSSDYDYSYSDSSDDSSYDSNDSYYDDSSDYYYEEEEDYSYTEDSSVASLRQQLVDYACSFAGWLPYVSGGASLSTGADCSGFTSAIYAAFGYSISRSSNAQAYVGRSVSLSEIQPGDIIIYSGHVALYVGNGLKVHSPYPGQVVTVNSMYNMTILDIRRVIE